MRKDLQAQRATGGEYFDLLFERRGRALLLARMGEPNGPGVFGAVNGYLLRPGGYAVLLLLFMSLMIMIYSSSTSSPEISGDLVVKTGLTRRIQTAGRTISTSTTSCHESKDTPMTTVVQRVITAARDGRLMTGMWRHFKDAVYGERNAFLKKCRGIIHVGANDGQERLLYAEHGLKVVWIEPIPDVFQQLVKNIRDFPDQSAINALITNEDGALRTLHISNNSGRSSSILDVHLHKDIWPEVTFTHDVTLRSTRLPTALAEIDLSQYDAMVLDTQGSELLVLQSAATILSGFKFIQVEAANFEAYRNCATVDTINTFLRNQGFRLLRKDLQAQRATGGEYFDLLFERR
jgi:FkbM family methyltransferase